MGIAQDTKIFPASWGPAAKPCDYCKSAAALLFCRSDSAFMCMACDTKVHPTKHERVWMCDVCEQAPASVTCKADAAALCVTCDHDIHSANPLARRHERSPVAPFYDTAESVVKSTAATLLVPPFKDSDNTIGPDSKISNCVGNDVFLTDPWMGSNSLVPKLQPDSSEMKPIEFLLSEQDNFLDFDYPVCSETRLNQHYDLGNDSVVPVQAIKPPAPAAKVNDHSHPRHFEIDFTRSNINSYNNSYTTAPSLSHSVSSSSLDVGVVPDGSSLSEISYPFGGNMSSGVELSGSGVGNQGSQTVGMDREARVLRYREKRKNRKFEKTIRYASRKAYAETRPRIKGRFAKRTDVDSDLDSIFSADYISADAARYGVVPSF